MLRASLVFFLLSLLGLRGECARAGAWTQPVGGIYAESSWLSLTTDERLSCTGGSTEAEPFGGTYSDRQLFLYGEYGWREATTLLGSFAWKRQEIVDATIPSYGTRSTGDLRAGVRQALLRGPWPVSVEALVSVPTYPETDPAAPVGTREQFLPAGTGRWGGELRLQAGRSLHPLPFYVSVEAGRRFRGGPFADQWLVAGEVGTSSPRLFAKVDLRAVLPTGEVCGSSAAGAVSTHERNVGLGPKLGLRARGDLWVFLGATSVISGRNTLDGTQWSLSLAWLGRPD